MEGALLALHTRALSRLHLLGPLAAQGRGLHRSAAGRLLRLPRMQLCAQPQGHAIVDPDSRLSLRGDRSSPRATSPAAGSPTWPWAASISRSSTISSRACPSRDLARAQGLVRAFCLANNLHYSEDTLSRVPTARRSVLSGGLPSRPRHAPSLSLRRRVRVQGEVDPGQAVQHVPLRRERPDHERGGDKVPPASGPARPALRQSAGDSA